MDHNNRDALTAAFQALARLQSEITTCTLELRLARGAAAAGLRSRQAVLRRQWEEASRAYARLLER